MATTPEHPGSAQAIPLPFPPLHALGTGLRPWGVGEDDARALLRAWTDPEIALWTQAPESADLSRAEAWIEGEDARRNAGLAVDLVITEVGAAATVLGEVGIAVLDRDRGWAEIGYWLFESARGSGRASIATRLMADWALDEAGMTRLIARVRKGNERSAAVLARAGFHHAGTLDDGSAAWLRNAEAATNA